MIEIEFSALARQCLNRRISDILTLEKQVLALVARRNKIRIKINWQFSIQKARTKMQKQYSRILDCRQSYVK